MKGDITKTFEITYSQESDSIFRFCLMRVSDREQALDITQETFLRLWKTLSKDEEIVNVRAFLFKVTRNLIIDWYRKKKSFSLDAMTEEREDGQFDVVDKTTLDCLEAGPEGRYLLDKVSELSNGSKDPVYLRFVEGLSPKEIGDILGITTNAASVRINRGLAELREKTGYKEI